MLRENLAGVAAGAKAADRDANVKAAMAANFMVTLSRRKRYAMTRMTETTRGELTHPSLILLSLYLVPE